MTLNIEIPRKTPTESSLRPRPLVVFFAFFIAKPCAKARNYYEHPYSKDLHWRETFTCSCASDELISFNKFVL